MNKYIITILVLIFGLIKPLIAQQELMSYTMSNTPYGKSLNPAKKLDKKIEISIANIFSTIDLKGPSLKDISNINSSGGLTINANKLNDALLDENLFNTNSYIQTLNIAFRIKGIEFDIGHALRQQSHVLYPKELVSLILNGNADYIGKTMPLGAKASLLSFHQLNLGIATEIGQLRIGGNLKFLNGIFSLTTENNKLNLNTSDDIYQLELDANYTINNTGLFSINDTNAVTTNFDRLSSFEFNGANNGFALDLGAVYNVNDKLMISASVLDLGSITWRENIDNYTLDTIVSFEGLEIEDLIDNEGSISLKDTLNSLLNFKRTNKEYKTSLSPSIYFSVRYKLNDKLSFTGLYHRQQHDNFSSNAISISTQYSISKAIHLGLLYAIRDGHANNLGLSSILNLGPVNLYVATDNILAVLLPESARHLNFRVGSSLVF